MFNCYRPESLEATLKVINEEKCHIFAGGTDLMIRKRQWQGAERKFTQAVCYINQLTAYRFVKEEENQYILGTLATQTDVVESKLPDFIRVPYSLMSHPAIRNMATVGGNIVNAASVADSLPILYALDAEVELQSIDGIRRLKVSDFVVDKYKTLRKDNELLTQVFIPKFEAEDYFYKKLGQRKASILSKVSVFVLKKKDDIRIAIGAINDTVIRSRALEEAYIKNKDIDALLAGYLTLMNGIDDKRSTKKYRENTALNMIRAYLEGE
jgi:CO/xanthine dehydrogenase FAD-binding subunit